MLKLNTNRKLCASYLLVQMLMTFSDIERSKSLYLRKPWSLGH